MTSYPAKRVWPDILLIALLLLSVYAWCDFASKSQILAFAEQKYGRGGRARMEDWYELLDKQKDASIKDKLNKVNRFFNSIRWMPDEEHWGKKDYWATPIEMLGTDGGDCEDFAIAKYFTLKELGVPEEKLRITYVIATHINQAHMVLAYYETPNAEPLVLDNMKDRVSTASDRKDLRPVYSFNGSGLWLAKERNTQLTARKNSLTTWLDVNQRILREVNAMQAFLLICCSGCFPRRKRLRSAANQLTYFQDKS